MSTTPQFCDVLLPLPLPRYFTYVVPEQFHSTLQVGMRVVVPFGAKKITTALVHSIHSHAPAHYSAKSILDVLEESPSVTSIQFELMEWIADYYMCTPGEVMQAALPSGLKLTSESIVQLHPLFIQKEEEDWTEIELKIIAALRHKDLTYSDIAKIADTDRIHTLLKRLVQKQAILLVEELKESFKPKFITYLSLSSIHATKTGIADLLQQLEKKPKQQDIILHYLQEVPVVHHPELNAKGVEKNKLLERIESTSSLQTLLKNGVLKERKEAVHRIQLPDGFQTSPPKPLSEAQLKAKESILSSFQEKDTVLLHGVTGSGKTEIYIDLIHQTIEGGSQALFLLPEIALTTHMVDRLMQVFGNKLGVYHSRFSDNERVEVWQGLLEGRFDVIVGVRSSIFLPFHNLGLIIVDEEHETSYKQQDPAPRYHARDVALVLAKKHHAKTLLGSATPTLESYEAAITKRWGYVPLLHRHEKVNPPELHFVSMRQEQKNKSIQHGFSLVLTEALRSNLADKKQSIVFQNRRGYAPILRCEDCGTIPECPSCSVALTYHQFAHELRCHYCGFVQKTPKGCYECGSANLHFVGSGTERIEEDLSYVLPEAKILRMDLDTTRKKNAFSEIFQSMENKEIDVLVGTQMVTKGLDFEHVELVAVYDADRMLNMPDYRSMERARQTLMQVSGRAGRKSGKGNVYIQTFRPEHPVFQYLENSKAEEFYLRELHERKEYNYPPYTRIIRLSVLHKDKSVADTGAKQIAHTLQLAFGSKRVLGAHPAYIEKLRNYYHFEIFIKLERDIQGLRSYKDKIKTVVEDICALPDHKKTRVIIDVDPS